MASIKAEERQRQETVGIPVEVLRTIGRQVGMTARKRVSDYVPLGRRLWDDHGREGRVVSAVMLGHMELAEPERIIPVLLELCRTCLTWEDADQLAMRALEPIVRKDPEQWLGTLEGWLTDESKWVQRAGITVIGRLPMKHPSTTFLCLELSEQLLCAEEKEVRKALSFAIRLCARGQIEPVRAFLARHVPPDDPAATWALCDVVRRMTRQFQPELVPLLPLFEAWEADPELGGRDRRSVASAVKALRRAQDRRSPD
jgi:3-methyladenine DNA glycosylase AlkD